MWWSLACAPMIPETGTLATTPTPSTAPLYDPDDAFADALAVAVSGDEGAYVFDVTLLSPDEGCDRYADWWEVLSPDGALLFRRILTHSHVDEQPFTRDGSPVPVLADTALVVRGHMVPDGYGGQAMSGTVRDGFVATIPEPGWAAEIERDDPQPESCLF